MSPRSRNPDEAFDADELAAADWLARQEFGLNESEAAELQQWLDSSPQRARIFRELRAAQAIIDRHPAALESPAVGSPGPSARRGWLRPAAILAVAAVLALGAFTIFRLTSEREGDFVLKSTTEVGGLRVLALPDGSTVRLNTNSAVAVRYNAAARRVQLTRGEASFTVAKDTNRPFWVEASGVAVRAVGTEFVVRMRPDEVDILVTEGHVQVENAAAKSLLPARSGGTAAAESVPLLSAGERVRVPLQGSAPGPATKVAEVGPAQIARSLAWQERRLSFEGVPLAEMVSEFNRYNRHQLVIEDGALRAEKFGGTFQANLPDALVSLLEQSFDVASERRGDVTYLRRRR